MILSARLLFAVITCILPIVHTKRYGMFVKQSFIVKSIWIMNNVLSSSGKLITTNWCFYYTNCTIIWYSKITGDKFGMVDIFKMTSKSHSYAYHM